VAHKLGLHESTVGRAVTGKFALIPAGEVVACEMFFDASLSVKEVIKDLLAKRMAANLIRTNRSASSWPTWA